MTGSSIIRRRHLRDDVQNEIVGRVVRGELKGGTRVNEVELADELGVSRTPLREALLSLEKEGLLESRPGQGWVVVRLTPDVAEEVYPIISALEVLALRSSDPADVAANVSELNRLNAELRAVAGDAAAAQALDDQWHQLLLSPCPNERLHEQIASMKRLVHRYEYAYLGAAGTIERSLEQHAAIATAVEAGDVESAATTLEANWRDSMRAMSDWLRLDAVDP